MKQIIIIILLLVALMLILAFKGFSKNTDSNYFKSYINTDLVGGFVD